MLGAQGTGIEKGWRLQQLELHSAGGWLGKPQGVESRDSQLNRWESRSCPPTTCASQAGMAVHVVHIVAIASTLWLLSLPLTICKRQHLNRWQSAWLVQIAVRSSRADRKLLCQMGFPPP